jgi:hypothetical protein
MSTQNYKSHRRYVPLYHFGLLVIIIAVLAGSIWNFYRAYDAHAGRLVAALIFALDIIAIFFYIYARQFALVAQDRAIRAEENLRHYILTGKGLDSRLRLSQVIALRFAGDEEFVALAERAATENMRADDIKKAIHSWRADNCRV